jgi:hypothetical protein
MRVLLHASELVVYDGRTEVARHQRLATRGGSRLYLDHYLEGLLRKPGALPGATALDQARAAGKFTPVHDAWQEARQPGYGADGPGAAGGPARAPRRGLFAFTEPGLPPGCELPDDAVGVARFVVHGPYPGGEADVGSLVSTGAAAVASGAAGPVNAQAAGRPAAPSAPRSAGAPAPDPTWTGSRTAAGSARCRPAAARPWPGRTCGDRPSSVPADNSRSWPAGPCAAPRRTHPKPSGGLLVPWCKSQDYWTVIQVLSRT